MAIPLGELSVYGVLGRIERIEHLKNDVAHPSEEEQALIATEPAVKKAAAELLSAAVAEGLSKPAKGKAKAFLQAQVTALSSDAPAARKAKLKELLDGITKSPEAQDPEHVRRARDALKRIETEYKKVHDEYVKWEKGKAKLMDVAELTAMKRSHEKLEKLLDAAKQHLELEEQLRNGSGEAPPSLPSTGAGKAKSKAQAVVRHAPAVRPATAPAPVKSDTLRQAQMVAQVRSKAAPAPGFAASASGAREQEMFVTSQPRQKTAPAPPTDSAPEVILAYNFTVKAIVEVMRMSTKEVNEFGSTVSELRELFDEEAWGAISAKSVALEDMDKEKKRLAERRRMEAALNRKAEEYAPQPVAGSARPKTAPGLQTQVSASRAPVPVAVAPKAVSAKPQSPPKAKPKPRGAAALQGMASKNKFSVMEDSDDDDDDDGGWATVKR